MTMSASSAQSFFEEDIRSLLPCLEALNSQGPLDPPIWEEVCRQREDMNLRVRTVLHSFDNALSVALPTEKTLLQMLLDVWNMRYECIAHGCFEKCIENPLVLQDLSQGKRQWTKIKQTWRTQAGLPCISRTRKPASRSHRRKNKVYRHGENDAFTPEHGSAYSDVKPPGRQWMVPRGTHAQQFPHDHSNDDSQSENDSVNGLWDMEDEWQIGQPHNPSAAHSRHDHHGTVPNMAAPASTSRPPSHLPFQHPQQGTRAPAKGKGVSPIAPVEGAKGGFKSGNFQSPNPRQASGWQAHPQSHWHAAESQGPGEGNRAQSAGSAWLSAGESGLAAAHRQALPSGWKTGKIDTGEEYFWDEGADDPTSTITFTRPGEAPAEDSTVNNERIRRAQYYKQAAKYSNQQM